MVKCKKCNVYINTSVKTCPLCKNQLDENSEETNNIFPNVPPIVQNGLWKKVLGFIIFFIIVISLLIDFIISKAITWSAFVAIALLCVSLSLLIAEQQKRSFSSILCFEYIFLCGISYYWDRMIGYHLWSINFVIPLLSMVFAILNYILRFVFKKSLVKYYRNSMIASIVAIVCAILARMDIIPVPLPSYIAGIACAVIFLISSIIDGRAFLVELSKRMHV